MELSRGPSVENAKMVREDGVSLSRSELERHEGWLTVGFPVVDRRRRSKLLTPYGWFVVLSIIALAMGVVLGFTM